MFPYEYDETSYPIRASTTSNAFQSHNQRNVMEDHSPASNDTARASSSGDAFEHLSPAEDDRTIRNSTPDKDTDGKSGKRKPHRKSRSGCQNCKTRRIKVRSLIVPKTIDTLMTRHSVMKANLNATAARSAKSSAAISAPSIIAVVCIPMEI
jgi:hypothetical protein